MYLEFTNPLNSLNKALRREKVWRVEFENFKKELNRLISGINEQESEEHLKYPLRDFLKNTFYNSREVNTKAGIDLAVYLGSTDKSDVGVMIETKKPSNRAEMPTANAPNCKAMHEVVLYYLRERDEAKNSGIKRIIITNCYEWYIFDAHTFDRLFYNSPLKREYREWKTGQKSSPNTDVFYNECIKPFLAEDDTAIPCTRFDLRDFQDALESSEEKDEKKIVSVFKIFSPAHLLKEPFANDSNTLNRKFYNELLHIMGLYETKRGANRIILRKGEKSRAPGSFIENTIATLEAESRLNKIEEAEQYGETDEERLFATALELNITWLNRILFLKLLEAQMVAWHNGDDAYKFLTPEKIPDFDELNTLFFEILAKKRHERKEYLADKFRHVPYLNSSLFETSRLEDDALRINSLKDRFSIPVFSQTVLLNDKRKKLTGEMPTLEYLLAFLDAYDFSAEGADEIREYKKTLISASVLGLLFEKINGYKEGSFFTPGFVTMYMCRETIRRTVLQKFKEVRGWHCESIGDLKDHIGGGREDRKEANEIINSLKICDPAVGSGHFLVSALNEIIALKSELNVLAYENGDRVKFYKIEVQNDDLIIIDEEEGDLFEYKLGAKNRPVSEKQRLQEALFHEKLTLIENCLFGVDINANSVSICRLRLWIELLKYAYYTKDSDYKELETLPNIDINIKKGNSLISRFDINNQHAALPASMQQKLKVATEKYKKQVVIYKATDDREVRRIAEKEIKRIKEQYAEIANPADKDYKRLQEKKAELAQKPLTFNREDWEEWTRKTESLAKEVAELEEAYNEKLKTIYGNAFEWRFEFPEVLDEDGKFAGFDMVMGNPPYIRQEAIKALKPALKERYTIFDGIADIYTYFIELSYNLLKPDGNFIFIVSNKFTRANYGRRLRRFLSEKVCLTRFLDFRGVPVFDNAVVDVAILSFVKRESNQDDRKGFLYSGINREVLETGIPKQIALDAQCLERKLLTSEKWSFEQPRILKLKEKIDAQGLTLAKWNMKIYRGIVTGFNEAFIIDGKTKDKLCKDDPKSAEIIKPLLRGKDIKKYCPDFHDLWLICTFPARKYCINDFKAVKEHLLAFGKERLEPSGKKGCRKKTGSKWFETQDNIAYWRQFEQSKIIYKDIAQKLTFTFDASQYYLLNTAYFINAEKNNLYLLSILNSKLMDWYYRKVSVQLGDKGIRHFTIYIETIPVKDVEENEKAGFEDKVSQILAAKKSDPDADTSELEAEIDRMVYDLYGLDGDEVEIVEAGV